MKVLVACEFSGIVREAFKERGHDAWSCDLLESEIPGQHIVGDVREILQDGWDLMIAHPPCTYLCVSGASWINTPEKIQLQEDALDFVLDLMNAKIKKICIENPVGVIGTRIEKASQYIQPWQFGHEEQKKTGLWLKNLPLLIPTKIMKNRSKNVIGARKNNKLGPSPSRWMDRSRTYTGIAEAMADQWG